MSNGSFYKLYKIGNFCVKHKLLVCSKIFGGIKRILYPCCDIPFTTEIGENASFPHRAIGVIIHSNAKIGSNVKIEANVVIGGNFGKGIPTIGNNVFIGAGAIIIGNVKVGDNCVIGAGAVVTKDVLPNTVVGGVPAKAIKNKYSSWKNERGRNEENKKYD